MKPKLAITMGDVAGVGPEICVKVLSKPEIHDICSPILIGEESALISAFRTVGTKNLRMNRVETLDHLADQAGVVDLLVPAGVTANVEQGKIAAEAGENAVRFIHAAAELAKRAEVDAIVTAPLNKAAMHAAGHLYPGHTELLAEIFGVDEYSLVLSADELNIYHITTHVALKLAVDMVTKERALATIRLASVFAALDEGDNEIAVVGLNPHAGEGGLFGDEDLQELVPAVRDAQEQGIRVVGPLPADAAIPSAVQGKWRHVVVCYHDQGHTPFKAVFGDRGVNITAGLPVVRTSVDHGTAFDIAGKGIARSESLEVAIEKAVKLVPKWGDVWKSTAPDRCQ